ncbi:MAG: hypothetical protein KTR30_12975 [Saprospiraceae bacterium]|nr:hypothetical protein [Saprospiraceae bacterium]
MIQRDYILRWTKELAMVLARLMGKDPKQQFEIISEAYHGTLHFKPDELDDLPPDRWLPFLTLERQLHEGQLDFLAHLIAREADYYFSQQLSDKSRLKAQQAIHIFDYLDQQQATLSMERQAAVTRMGHILQTLEQQK